jgi:hypothetical protein
MSSLEECEGALNDLTVIIANHQLIINELREIIGNGIKTQEKIYEYANALEERIKNLERGRYN